MPLALPPNDSQPPNYQIPILQKLTSPALVADTNWRIVMWNRAAELVYGWQGARKHPEQVQGKSLWEAIPILRYLDGISREEALAHLYQHSHWKGLAIQRRGDGREIVVESSLQLIRSESGAIVGIVSINNLFTKKAKSQKQKALQKNPFSRWTSTDTLYEKKSRFQIAADTAPVMLWMSGPDALCSFFNQYWLEFTGRTLLEELGNGWTAGIHPDDLQQCLESYRRAFEARRSFKIEYRLRRKDGEYCWILDAGNPWLARDGQFAGYVGACIDMSERKKAEEFLTKQQELLEKILEPQPNLIFVKDSDGKLVFAKAAVADFNSHPRQSEHFFRYDREVAKTGRSKFISEMVLRDSNSNPRWFETFKKSLSLPGSEILCVSDVATEIARHVGERDAKKIAFEDRQTRLQECIATLMQANEKLLVERQKRRGTKTARRTSSKFGTLLAEMGDVIWILDERGYYQEIVPTNLSLLQNPASELIGRSLHEVFERSQADIFLGYIQLALKTQQTLHVEYSLPSDDPVGGDCFAAKRWLAASISPTPENAVIWRARELGRSHSRQFNAEELLKEANEQLENRVQERTAALKESNDQLIVEIAQRVRAEKELRLHQERLEELVKERTADLEKINQQLRQEIVERKRIERELFKEKELAQVTLQSIGDAVITTDANGCITSLNPAAQRLTGWSESEAIGLAVSQVFRIVHELTRERVENPVETALFCQRVVELSNHSLLIARDGKELAIDESAAPILASDGQIVGAVLVFHDVTEERALARRLSWQASHDALTNLANRREFEQHLQRAWLAAQTHNQQHTLCYMDLDRFKYVNDTCGHVAGDELLRQLSALLQSKIRKTDILARLGGDEFALLLQHCSLEEGARVANELRQIVQEFRFLWRDKTFAIGVSIGVVLIDAYSNSPTSLMSAADGACYEAKNQGRDRVNIYKASEVERARASGEIQWAIHLPKALESDRFHLYYQPIISVAATEHFSEHYEVLLRLEDESGKLVSPTAFLPAAERYNLMPTIDRWAIRTLFSKFGQHYREAWKRSQLQGSQCLYAVNLSGASLNDDKFIDFVIEQFTTYEVPPSVICFEIAETVAISNLSKAAALVGELKELGCRFTLDDFGSSVSCLAYLKNLPVNYLKIDGNFVKNIVNDPINLAMVEAINQIGHLMGLQTIAEFVENDAILRKLRELGVDYAQGYGIAKPHPLAIARAS